MIRWLTPLLLCTVLALNVPGNAVARQLIAAYDNWPPYEYPLDGERAGTAIEIVNSVFKRMDNDVPEYRFMSWKRCLYSLKYGDVDILVSGMYSKDRAEYAHFPSEELFHVHYVTFSLASNKKRLDYKKLHDLHRHTIGIVKEYVYPDIFKPLINGNPNIRRNANVMQSLKQLARNRLAYVLAAHRTIRFHARKLGINNRIVRVGPDPAPAPVYVLFSKRRVSKSFVEAFDRTLKDFKNTKEYKSIINRFLD